jgi:ADP-heptose:LPS heptosyltransferase
VAPDTDFADTIVIARSSRYRSPKISYRFLKYYPKLVFVGLPDEYEDFRQQVPEAVYHPVNNFLELARIIAGSRLFIGNQSFPFALAESLKVRRVLEVFYQSPNVMTEGPNGYAFCYQPQFEQIVHTLMSS